LYARTLAEEPSKQTLFNAEIFDINRAGARVRLLENGAAAFIPASLILANKERLDCNGDQGIITIDKEVVYRLGDTLEVVLTDVSQENRSIVAKPTQVFADEPQPEVEAQTENTQQTEISQEESAEQ
jgi:exoribonuclease-2